MSKLKRTIFLIYLSLLCVSVSEIAYALDQTTHNIINQNVATREYNNWSLDSYLKSNINIENGIWQIYNSSTIWEWIKAGGAYEDDRPLLYIRSFNHFHDPTKSSLDQGGLNTYWHGVHLTGVSSILWNLSKDLQKNAFGGLLGDYSWPATRDYFYQALTATDETTRTNNYVSLFRGIGQLMHLVEDASVPEHTRNEAHILNWNYETWVKNSSDVSGILNGTPIVPYSTVLAQQGNPDSRIGGLPISRLFDTDNYTGQNPSVTAGADIGRKVEVAGFVWTG